MTKVHRCGVYANIPAGGLSIRQKSYAKKSQRSLSTSSLSSMKQATPQRETIYRCSLCQSQFSHRRAIERHHYDVHRIDPFDAEAMKNATVEEEEMIENEQEINHSDEHEQMAIIQFRNQHHNAEQSPLIVKIERGLSRNFSFHINLFLFFVQMVMTTSKLQMIFSPIGQHHALVNCKKHLDDQRKRTFHIIPMLR